MRKNIIGITLSFFIYLTGYAQQFKYNHNDSKIVSQMGSYQLTAGDLNAAIEYMEFILAQKLNQKYTQAAQVSLKQEFERNPYSLATEMYQVRQILPSIARMTDVYQIATYRNQVIYALHTNFMYQQTRPVLLQLLDQLNPIMVYDALGQICLTQRDINAIIELGQFSSLLMGQPRQTVTNNDLQEMAKAMESQIYTMDATAKQQLIVLADQMPLMKAAYAQMSAAEQNQFKQQFIASMMTSQKTTQQQNDCPGCSQRMIDLKAKQANGTLTQSEFMELQNEINSRQNMMTMMSNMSLQHHATMLNVIDNMGDGNTYYKVEYNNW